MEEKFYDNNLSEIKKEKEKKLTEEEIDEKMENLKILGKNVEYTEDEIFLIRKAIGIYGDIFLCGTKKNLKECFTSDLKKKLIFWFNAEDKSTHMLTIEDANL